MLKYNQFIRNKKINESVKKNEYGCVMLYFNFPEVKNIHNKISEKDIFIDPNDDSFGIEDEPHCTLLYGIHEEVEDSMIEDILNDFTFNKCKVYDISLFENENFDVLKFNVSGEMLHECNKKLKELPHTSKYPDYKPHLTIAYLMPGTGKKYVDMFKDLKYELVPIHAVYSKTDGSKVEIEI